MSKRNVVHVEIPASDINASSEFYQALFSWKIVPMPEIGYTMWEAGDGSGGGFPQVSPETPAGQVLVYIASDDIDDDLKRVTQLGGTVLKEKTEIPGTGWFAVFQDPVGNILALYTGKGS